jgi:flavin-dependent dehydrogenase
LLIGADGASGITARQLAGFTLDRRHHCAAVRAYCRGLPGVEAGVNEFFLLEGYLPGYFWIFPLGNGWANIGFGMLSKAVADKNLNLRKTLQAIISTHPVLKERFAQAEIVEKTVGFGLPLGSRHWPLSGDGFLLAGDAGSLIDPLQGHGIDKAMLSGKLAAEQALRCFEHDRFDAAFLTEYSKEIYRRCGAAFRKNYLLLRLLNRFPGLVNLVVHIAQQKKLLNWMQRWMYG